MRANSSSLIRIEQPDGSAIEIQDCLLSDEPVMITAFQGATPTAVVNERRPLCLVADDRFTVAGTAFRRELPVHGDAFRPVHVRSESPRREPLACE